MSRVSPAPSLTKLLQKIIMESVEQIEDASIPDSESIEYKLSINRFRRRWYTPYYFVFRQNRYVTDISFGELVQLLRRHIKTPQPKLSLQFYTSKQLKQYLTAIFNQFANLTPFEFTSLANNISERFFDLFTHAVMIDPYFGSCVVVLPEGAKIDLAAICGESGYTYMAGRCIYMRKTANCTFDQLKQNILCYFADDKQYKPRSQNLPFRLFSDDLFPDDTRHLRKVVRHGLADQKIEPGKYFFGGLPMYAFLGRIEKDREISTRLSFPSDTRSDVLKEFPDKTIWLATETSFRLKSRYPGDDRFFVCFAQDYVNKAEFFIFDERAPGWSAPITFPHSLACAMLNLARPTTSARDGKGKGAKKSNRVRCCDPFVGTGTTLIQGIKFWEEMDFFVNDRSNITPRLILENLRFFCSAREELQGLLADLTLVKDELTRLQSLPQFATPSSRGVLAALIDDEAGVTKKSPAVPLVDSATVHARMDAFLEAVRLVKAEIRRYRQVGESPTGYQGIRQVTSHEFSDMLLGRLAEDTSFTEKMFFFLIWRALVKNIIPIFRTEVHHEYKICERFIAEEIEEFSEELRRMITVQKRPVLKKRDTFWVRRDEFSSCVTANQDLLQLAVADIKRKASQARINIATQDIANYLSPSSGQSFDVLLTDPPYGINAPELETHDQDSSGALTPSDNNFTAIQAIYRAVIGNIFSHLNDNGRILICLPDRVYQGQHIPAFLTEPFVRQQLLMRCGSQREVVDVAIDVPEGIVSGGSFYWESRALRRKVIHFGLRDRK